MAWQIRNKNYNYPPYLPQAGLVLASQFGTQFLGLGKVSRVER